MDAFLVKALLIAIIILLLPKLVTGVSPKRAERELRTMRNDCSETTESCRLLVLEERSNCIHRCISNSCFERVYGTQPLEDGEIDVARRRGFDKCVKSELRGTTKQTRRNDRVKEAKRRRAAHSA